MSIAGPTDAELVSQIKAAANSIKLVSLLTECDRRKITVDLTWNSATFVIDDAEEEVAISNAGYYTVSAEKDLTPRRKR